MRTYSFDAVDTHDGVGLGMGPLADSAAQDIDRHRASASASSSPLSTNANTQSNSSDARLLTGLMTQAEHVVTVTTRLKNTLTCIVIYVALMLLNVFVMSWEMSGRGYNPVIITLECLINLFIVAEVTIGVYGLGREYFKSVMNIVDFVLANACVVFFIFLMITRTAEEADYMSEVDAVLLAFRFAFQVLRLSVLIYRSRKVALMQVAEEVDFNAVSLEACIDDETADMRRMHDGRSRSGSTLSVSEQMIESVRQSLGMNGAHSSTSTATGVESSPSEIEMNNSNNGAVPPPVATTSYIHLKPSIYLELQNARAFAEPSTLVPSTSASALDSSVSPPLIAPLPHKHRLSLSHPNSYVDAVGLGSPNVPLITPPHSPDLAIDVASPIASSASPSESKVYPSATNSSRGLSLHPALAHDSEMEDEFSVSSYSPNQELQRIDTLHEEDHEQLGLI